MKPEELAPVLQQLQGLDTEELKGLGFTLEEALTVEILTNPVKWAEEYLGWNSRDYQDLILEQGAKARRLVLRLGRRLGKTECMCVLILWHAFTQINRDFTKADTDPYDILILTPVEKQIDLIFDRLLELIQASPELKGSLKHKKNHHIELLNGAIIQGMTVGANSNKGAANTRGQKADLLVYDEVDYMGDNEIANSIAIANEDKLRIKVLASSTPSGDRRSFYGWCTGSSYTYGADIDYIEATGEIKYNFSDRSGKGSNGWTQVYAPSTVNKKLYEINPDTGLTGMEELREEFSESRFQQEVMAEFGESESGVYQKRFLDLAVETGSEMQLKYVSDIKGVQVQDFPRLGPRILGVDWDKKGAATNMVGMQYLPEYDKFVPFARVEIPRHAFTYTEAVKMIIKLNEAYNFDWIYVDAGHGEMQIEDLVTYGMKNPKSNLHHKIVRVNFSEKVEIRDPFTLQKVKKDIKPFMVNNLVVAFERGRIALNPDDKHTIKQFTDYSIVRWGVDGRPIYSDTNEHIHDCIMLAMHGFVQKYTDIMKVKTSVSIARLGPIVYNDDSVKPREIAEEPEKSPFSGLSAFSGLKQKPMSGRRNMGMPKRSTF